MNEYADESREIAQDMFSCLLAQNNVWSLEHILTSCYSLATLIIN